jgi:TonB family protein
MRTLAAALTACALLIPAAIVAGQFTDPGRSLIPPHGLAGWTAQSRSSDCVRNDSDTLTVHECAGWLITDKPVFGDYSLTFEMRPSAGGGHVLLGVLGINTRDGRPDALVGIPVLGPTSALRRSSVNIQMLALADAARAQAMKPDGEWQAYAITRNGQGVHAMLNGTQILSSGPIRASDGWIGFRVEDGSFELRGMHLRDVTALSTKVSAADRGALVNGAYRPGRGVMLPKLVREVKPRYTAAALGAHIQGAVLVECIVGTDGKVTSPTVARSLDPDLDKEALEAARQWRFEPGTRDGVPVPIWITIELTFSIRK